MRPKGKVQVSKIVIDPQEGLGIPKGRDVLYLLPHGELRSAMSGKRFTVEVMSVAEWRENKKRKRTRSGEPYYLVLNPPEPFLPVTLERLKKYARGNRR